MKSRRRVCGWIVFLLVSVTLAGAAPAQGQSTPEPPNVRGNLLHNGNFTHGLKYWTPVRLLDGDAVQCAPDCRFGWSEAYSVRPRGLKTRLDYAGLAGDIVQVSVWMNYSAEDPPRLSLALVGAQVRRTACITRSLRGAWLLSQCQIHAPDDYSQIVLKILARSGGVIQIDDAALVVTAS